MQEFKYKVVLLGYSGHGFVVAEAAILVGMKIIGYSQQDEFSQNPFRLKYIGYEEDPNFEGWNIDCGFILGVGDNVIRRKIAATVRSNNKKVVQVIHPAASVSPYSTIDEGAFIARNVCINPLVTIGKDVIINTSASIDHECDIGSNVHIAPGVVLAGNVKVGDSTFIGANAVVKQGIQIGANALIGAGSVVLTNIPDNQVWVGNPAKRLK